MNIQRKYNEMKQENRARIMKALFLEAIILLGFEIVMYFIIQIGKFDVIDSTKIYFLKYCLVPTLSNITDFCIALLVIKKAKTDKTKDYAVFSCVYAFCANLTMFHNFFIVMPAFFVIPIIISSLFDNPHYTRFLSFVSFVLVCLFTPISVLYDPAWETTVYLLSTLGTLALICLVQFITTSIVMFSTSKNGLISDTQQFDSMKNEPLSIDPLTGLYNHTAFYSILSKTRVECVQESTIMTVALIDIDGFTAINDTYGHKNGDIIVSSYAEALIKHCGVQATLFRYGGDKFAAIFRSMTDKEVLNYMNEVRETLLAKEFPEMPDITIQASCGITEYHGESITIKEIIQSLEAAVAKAKSTGGNRSVINRQ